MHKRNFMVSATLLFLVPFLVTAETVDGELIKSLLAEIENLRQQIAVLQYGIVVQPSTPAAVSQPALVRFDRDLYMGLRNDDGVRDLQELLTDQGYYAGPISGNYGLLTFQAVQKFQSSSGIRASGYFGPLTREHANNLMQKIVGSVCGEEGCEGGTVLVKQLSIFPDADLAAIAGSYYSTTFRVKGGSGSYSVDFDGSLPSGMAAKEVFSRCETGSLCQQSDGLRFFGTPQEAGVYYFTIYAKDKTASGVIYGKELFSFIVEGEKVKESPVISDITGPTVLKAGQEGVYNIGAYDPNGGGGKLSHRVDWGDGVSESSSQGILHPFSNPFLRATTFSHVYQSPGEYLATFYAVNDYGIQSKKSLNITVKGTVAASAPYYEAGPARIRQYQSYTLEGKIRNAAPDSKISFYLLRPDGTFEYHPLLNTQSVFGILVGGNLYTDVKGNYDYTSGPWEIFGEPGVWTSWVSVGGVESNKVTHTISASASPFGQQPVTLRSPNGGENYGPGEAINVKWSTSMASPFGTNMRIELVDADYKYRVAPNPVAVVAGNVSSATEYYAFLSTGLNVVAGKRYKILLYRAGTDEILDESDGYFSISP